MKCFAFALSLLLLTSCSSIRPFNSENGKNCDGNQDYDKVNEHDSMLDDGASLSNDLPPAVSTKCRNQRFSTFQFPSL